jgi:protocatechuate 3,4-dioxygenase, beta subunit
MATYLIGSLGRREILIMAAVIAGSGAVLPLTHAAAEGALQRTPDQILGPFYPLKELSTDSDLTRVPGRSGRAAGQVLNVMGQVLNVAGQPIHNARVEIWQANSHGRYTHPSDANPAPLDPNFEGSAVLTTDADGRYRFKTIRPAPYPAGPNRMRPAHIHFQVSSRQDRIVTQMYFDDDPYNKSDPFLNSVRSAERQELLVKKLITPSPDFEPDSKIVLFDLVLLNG